MKKTVDPEMRKYVLTQLKKNSVEILISAVVRVLLIASVAAWVSALKTSIFNALAISLISAVIAFPAMWYAMVMDSVAEAIKRWSDLRGSIGNTER